MKNRSFAFQIFAVLVAGSLLIATVACNQSQIAAEVQIIGNAGATLAGIMNNPTLAGKIRTDTADAVAAVNGWKAGTTCQNVEQAIQILVTDYNDIAASFGSTVPPNVAALIGLAGSPVPPSVRSLDPHAAAGLSGSCTTQGRGGSLERGPSYQQG